MMSYHCTCVNKTLLLLLPTQSSRKSSVAMIRQGHHCKLLPEHTRGRGEHLRDGFSHHPLGYVSSCLRYAIHDRTQPQTIGKYCSWTPVPWGLTCSGFTTTRTGARRRAVSSIKESTFQFYNAPQAYPCDLRPKAQECQRKSNL